MGYFYTWRERHSNVLCNFVLCAWHLCCGADWTGAVRVLPRADGCSHKILCLKKKMYLKIAFGVLEKSLLCIRWVGG